MVSISGEESFLSTKGLLLWTTIFSSRDGINLAHKLVTPTFYKLFQLLLIFGRQFNQLLQHQVTFFTCSFCYIVTFCLRSISHSDFRKFFARLDLFNSVLLLGVCIVIFRIKSDRLRYIVVSAHLIYQFEHLIPSWRIFWIID